MTKAEANAVLDAAKENNRISVQAVNQALFVLGDLGVDMEKMREIMGVSCYVRTRQLEEV